MDYKMLPGLIFIVESKALAGTFKGLSNFTAKIVEKSEISLIDDTSGVEEDIFLAGKGLN